MPEPVIDLHTHSTASDGTDSPAALVACPYCDHVAFAREFLQPFGCTLCGIEGNRGHRGVLMNPLSMMEATP